MMIKILLLLIPTIVSCFLYPKVSMLKKDCGFPNGTDTGIHIFNCNSRLDMSIKIINGKLVSKTGEIIYPIDPRISMILHLEAQNNGVQINNNRVNVKIYEYTNYWLSNKCKWIDVPTFGLLNNIDGCKYSHNCPLKKGKIDVKIPLDLSPYSSIIDLLASRKAYQIDVKMYNYNYNDTKHEEFACASTQLRFKI
uniref:ML domain-containing protein n=1 Tax=Parastrongyloides trichosuri TaxID=131310 RepID=A0A0N4Z9X3_PARTI